jgi:hypothetical protein
MQFAHMCVCAADWECYPASIDFAPPPSYDSPARGRCRSTERNVGLEDVMNLRSIGNPIAVASFVAMPAASSLVGPGADTAQTTAAATRDAQGVAGKLPVPGALYIALPTKIVDGSGATTRAVGIETKGQKGVGE